MINRLKVKDSKQILDLFIPIVLTMILTNTLSLIDSAMVANYDLIGVSSIAIVSQIQFLFGPMYFGIAAGVSIYTVQYYSAEKYDKLKNLAAISLTILLVFDLANFLVLTFFGTNIINFLAPHDEYFSTVTNLSRQYLNIYKYSVLLIPIEMFFVYQYRSIKKPKISLYLGVLQSVLNIVLNALLIYGLFFFPELGMVGAAISTVLSRFVSISLYITYTYVTSPPFIGKIKEMFSFDMALFKEVVKSIYPLVLVEFGFGFGNILYLKIYSLTGTEGYTAFQVAKNISFIVNAFVMGTANISGILAGTYIAVEETSQEVKKKMRNLFKFIGYNSVFLVLTSIFILPLFIPFFTTDKNYVLIVRELLIINGLWMSLRVFSSSFIAILKSGNDNKFVFLIDAGITYLVGIPLTILFFYAFSPSIVGLRSIILIEFTCKILLGIYRYRKEIWINKV